MCECIQRIGCPNEGTYFGNLCPINAFSWNCRVGNVLASEYIPHIHSIFEWKKSSRRWVGLAIFNQSINLDIIYRTQLDRSTVNRVLDTFSDLICTLQCQDLIAEDE